MKCSSNLQNIFSNKFGLFWDLNYKTYYCSNCCRIVISWSVCHPSLILQARMEITIVEPLMKLNFNGMLYVSVPHDAQYYDILQNDIQHNDTQHKGLFVTYSINVQRINVQTYKRTQHKRHPAQTTSLSITAFCHIKCRYAECHISFIIILNGVILNVIMWSVFRLNVTGPCRFAECRSSNKVKWKSASLFNTNISL